MFEWFCICKQKPLVDNDRSHNQHQMNKLVKCEACEIYLHPNALKEHEAGKKHLRKARDLMETYASTNILWSVYPSNQSNPSGLASLSRSVLHHCALCDVQVHPNNIKSHEGGKFHTKNKLQRDIKTAASAVESGVLSKLSELNHLLLKFEKEEKTSAKKARKALSEVHINIIDLLNGQLVVHQTVSALKRYTMKTRKFFPLSVAKDGTRGELRPFLRRLK